MMQAFSTPSNRKRTFILFGICVALAVAAAAVGVADNLPGILLAFASKTIDRNRDWKDETVLFAKTIAQEPKSPRAHAATAEAAERSGDVAKAVREYQIALDLKPDYYAALVGLGQIYTYEGRYDDAVKLIERAVTMTPNDSKMIGNLGFLYLHTNQLE